MGEVDITAGFYMVGKFDKGIALIGYKTTSVADGETLITPFIRCVPVVTPAATGALNGATPATHYVTESAGTITFIKGADGTLPTEYHVLIMGAMYGTV